MSDTVIGMIAAEESNFTATAPLFMSDTLQGWLQHYVDGHISWLVTASGPRGAAEASPAIGSYRCEAAIGLFTSNFRFGSTAGVRDAQIPATNESLPAPNELRRYHGPNK